MTPGIIVSYSQCIAMNPDTTGSLIVVIGGALFIWWAGASLNPESRLRHLYGVDASDENAVRANAAVVALCGIGMWLLAGAIYGGVSERFIGTGTVMGTGLLCIGLGWLIRYRDRRDLLTTPEVPRTTARRLGGAAILCGFLVLPLGVAIWLRVSSEILVSIALGESVVSLLVVAYAYR